MAPASSDVAASEHEFVNRRRNGFSGAYGDVWQAHEGLVRQEFTTAATIRESSILELSEGANDKDVREAHANFLAEERNEACDEPLERNKRKR
jgi:hypothetical protein